MNPEIFWWIASIVLVLAIFRIAQWFLVHPKSKDEIEVMQPRLAGKSPMGGEVLLEEMYFNSEPSEMGSTGIVPGGVSYTLEPESRRAAIELGKKRFGRGQ